MEPDTIFQKTERIGPILSGSSRTSATHTLRARLEVPMPFTRGAVDGASAQIPPELGDSVSFKIKV